MKRRRKWIGVLTLLVFITATAAPGSHANAQHQHENKSPNSIQVSAHDDCEHDGAAKDPCCDQKDKSHCCDKGVCRCADGSCHGTVKAFGNSSIAELSVVGTKLQFLLTEESSASGLTERIKRPPKA